MVVAYIFDDFNKQGFLFISLFCYLIIYFSTQGQVYIQVQIYAYTLKYFTK